MADKGIFRVMYPIETLDGGLNSKYDPNIIADNESPDCYNVVFDDLGGVQTRQGIKKLNTAAVGSFAGDGLFTCRFNNGTEKMVGWWNGTMFQLSGTSFVTVPSAQSVFTAGTRVDMFMYQNLAFFGNGGTLPYKWNGTEFTRHGVYQPNSGPTAISGAAAASMPPTGDINYKVSYVNSYVVEGNVSAETTTLAVATSASVSITCLPIAPISFGVNARKLYRRDSTTGGVFKLVTTFNDNTTTNYTDTVDPTLLGASAPVDNGVPPTWSYGISHQERAWLNDPTNPSYGYYSELTNPFVVKALNFIPIGDGDGEIINGIGIHANNICYYKDSSVWLIYMPDTTPGNWVRLKSLSKYGGASHYAKPDYQQLQMFIGKRYNVIAGFYTLAGVDTKPEATLTTVAAIYSDSKSDKIEPNVLAFNSTGIKYASGIEFKNKLWFTVPSGTSTTNNAVWQFDFQRRTEDQSKGAWVPFSYPVNFTCFTVYAGKLYGQALTANGFVYQMDPAQYSDDSTAINSYYYTKQYQGHPEHWRNRKDFRDVYLNVETLGSWYMNVGIRLDGADAATTNYQVDLTPGLAVWGTAVWGAFTWGAGNKPKLVRLSLGSYAGNKIQFYFSNQNVAGQAFHVLPNALFSYNVRGLR